MRRSAAPREIPPPLELECLKILWDLGEGTVHQIRRKWSEKRSLAYTTILTLLDRLEKRGSVTRRKLGRAFVYAPRVTRETMRGHALKELTDGFFDGSEEALAAYLRERREPRL
jgi:BlaI family transcriptional regulator, penicillinase repressor